MMFSYFTEAELACKCGCDGKMDETFMRKVNHLRSVIGEPFIVNSAYRCPEYNRKVSITGLKGPHTTGRAIDIKANARLKSRILQAAIQLGMTRFGIGKSFIHIDDLNEAAGGFDGHVIWTY